LSVSTPNRKCKAWDHFRITLTNYNFKDIGILHTEGLV